MWAAFATKNCGYNTQYNNNDMCSCARASECVRLLFSLSLNLKLCVDCNSNAKKWFCSHKPRVLLWFLTIYRAHIVIVGFPSPLLRAHILFFISRHCVWVFAQANVQCTHKRKSSADPVNREYIRHCMWCHAHTHTAHSINDFDQF